MHQIGQDIDCNLEDIIDTMEVDTLQNILEEYSLQVMERTLPPEYPSLPDQTLDCLTQQLQGVAN